MIDGLSSEQVRGFWAGPGAAMPLVEPIDGTDEVAVTFCWRDAVASQVLLFANRLTDETNLADTLLERLGDTDLWHASFRMRADWRASYSFLVARPGEPAPWQSADGHVALRAALDRGLRDPRNPSTCPNRAGIVQSVVALPDAPPQPWVARRRGVARGTVSALPGPARRQVWVYEPPGGMADARLPLLIVLDGEVWTGPLDLPATLDNLHADGAVAPFRAVFLDSGGRDARWDELGAGGSGGSYVVEELLPWLAGIRPVAADPHGVAVAGQSLGGLAALTIGLSRPDAVGTVISHSASLWQDDLSAVVTPAAAGLRVWLAHGLQEWVLDAPHRDLATRLRTVGVQVDALPYNGGHDYACWRGGIADALVSIWGTGLPAR
ncbi:MAG: DUF3327 domain-containing protein [Nocardioidaceae bacterium]